MTPAQRETFAQTQALMSLLEGYSNHVMNAAGARILPNFAEVHARFERRGERRGTVERAIMRLTGLDLKMEQYAAGERFADAVIAERGRDFLNRVWTGPETLPSLDEIRQPRAVDRAHRGLHALSDSTTVLATPILGAPLSRELVARIESVDGVRCARIAADGRIHGDADESVFEDAEILLLGAVPAGVLDHLVSRAPKLRWVHSASAGVDRISTAAVRERRLVVTNARGVFSRPIAEYVVMMALAISRRLPQLLELQRERTWQPLRGRELSELTVGIVGYGSIGEEVAHLLAPFGCRIIATRRHPDRGAGRCRGRSSCSASTSCARSSGRATSSSSRHR